jgi:hypothetical protein
MSRNPLRVTFDSNTYRQAVAPCGARDASSSDLQKIKDALRDGRVRGYLSDTIIKLEGIENKDRVPVLGSTRLVSQSRATDENAITIGLSMRQNRKPLNPITLKWIQAAQELSMRFMRSGSRWFSGAGHIPDVDGTFYEPEESITALIERMDKVNRVSEAIQARGLGYAVAVCARGGADGERLQGLMRVGNQSEEAAVQRAVAEWADGDSIAAHIGYDNDLFCSNDKGRGTGGKPSILDEQNRAWLTATYGVNFVTLTRECRVLRYFPAARCCS